MPTTSGVKNLGREAGISQKEEGLDTTTYPHCFGVLSATSSINTDNTACLTQCFTTGSKLNRPSQPTSCCFPIRPFRISMLVFSLLYLWAINDIVLIILPLNETFGFFCHFTDLLTALSWQSEPWYFTAAHETWVLDDQSTEESEGSLQVGLQKEGFSLCTDPRIGGQEFLPLENWIPVLLFCNYWFWLLFTTQCKLQKKWIMEAVFSSRSECPQVQEWIIWCGTTFF